MIIFSEYAWSKLRWFRVNCHEGNVSDYKIQNPTFLEVSLMGVSYSEENIGYITDFICVPQEVSGGLTEPTDQGMMDYMESMLLDKGISPLRCGRFWAHTHPGTSPTPSGTDNDTFKKFFEHSDFAVMYILADGDDSCRVKHGTKYFGNTITNMATYVQYNSIASNGQYYMLNTKSLFSIDKIGVSDGYSNISKIMANDYSDYYEEWMKELKGAVKKKYGNITPASTTTTSSNNHNHSRAKGTGTYKKIGFTQAGTGEATNIKQGFVKYPVYSLIKLLIDNNKENINQFNKKDLKKIADNKNISIGDIQDTYNRMRRFEQDFDLADLLVHEESVITQDGKSNFHNLTREKLTEICCTLFIRPIVLKDFIDKYIEKTLSIFGGQI